ncbi:MAG: NAD(P)-dependent oxidoreductase [Gammaproteobacteria bacterium]|nr:NAD(P)-dependent oxidoreductase [Gammaproteobacteria bacterium]
MSKNKLTVLITGASGFLGKAIIKAFAEDKNVIIVAACRDKQKLPRSFTGEVRAGDLRDRVYLKSMVQGIDVICHAGTWAAMWGHTKQEQQNFYLPALDLIEYAIEAGVKRFLLTSSVVVAKKDKDTRLIDDFSKSQKTKFWPHLDFLIDLDEHMKKNAQRGMQMVNMRLGHFVGAENTMGLVPVLVPRLKTHLVPWLANGKSRLPLIADSDLGDAFVKASSATNLLNYESFNICGQAFPTTKEVINHISEKTGLATPWFTVPYPIGYVFAFVMEKFFIIMPGKSPFLTRSVVHLAEEWVCNTEYAKNKLGYQAKKDWHIVLDESLEKLKEENYPWPYMAQSSK